nr:hypothetical transcript [Hymenolepis microstoma]
MAILDSYVDEKIVATKLTEVNVVVNATKPTPLPTIVKQPPKITGISAIKVGPGEYISGCGEHYNVFVNDTALNFIFKEEGNSVIKRYRFTQFTDPNQFYQVEVQGGVYQFQAKLARGLYVLSVLDSGPDGESTEVYRIFEIEDPTEHAMICQSFDQKRNLSFVNLLAFSTPSMKLVRFKTFNEPGPSNWQESGLKIQPPRSKKKEIIRFCPVEYSQSGILNEL